MCLWVHSHVVSCNSLFRLSISCEGNDCLIVWLVFVKIKRKKLSEKGKVMCRRSE